MHSEPVTNTLRAILFGIGFLFAVACAPFAAAGVTRGIAEADMRTAYDCPDLTRDESACALAHYEQLALDVDARTAMRALANDARVSGKILDCHPMAHAIGRVAASRYASVGEAFAVGDPYCWSGYYHGVIEGTMRGIKKEAFTKDLLDGICADLAFSARSGVGAVANCAHGLGHALRYAHTGDLPGALAACDRLSSDHQARNCATGAYMEELAGRDSANTEHFSESSAARNPDQFCNDAHERLRESCFTIFPDLLLMTMPLAEVFARCDILAPADASTCTRGIGKNLTMRNGYDDAANRAACMSASTDTRRAECAEGVARDMIGFFGGADRALKFCSMFDPGIAERCVADASYVAGAGTP